MCVSCVCERSPVEWVPVAGLDGKWSPVGSAGGASPGSTGLQLPECRLSGGWNREEEEKGGSKQEREGRKLGAGSREGGRAKSPGDTGRGGEEEGITARTEPIPEREAAVAERSRAKS